MEKLPRRLYEATKVGEMLCKFTADYQIFTIQDELGNERAVIFKNEDLDSLYDDTSGEIGKDDIVDFLSKAVLPNLN